MPNRKTFDGFYRQIKDGDDILQLAEKFEMTDTEIVGLIELMSITGYKIEIVNVDNKFVVNKGLKMRRSKRLEKPNKEDLKLLKLGVVSDTHLGSKLQQLTLLNKFYQKGYEREVDAFVNCGDVCDGDYRNRPEHLHSLFAIGADQQVDNVLEYYPEVNGINTFFITGSHDETHIKNGGTDFGKAVAKNRKDMIYLGPDESTIEFDKVLIEAKHPGGGSAKAWSYKPQRIIEDMPSGHKPKAIFIGHYHKCLYMLYRNVHAALIPCMVDQSQFMKKQSLANIVGGYFFDIYYDNDGSIHYMLPEPMLFGPKDMIENDYPTPKANRRCKKLTIH